MTQTPAAPDPADFLAQIEGLVNQKVAEALQSEGFEVQTPVQSAYPHPLAAGPEDLDELIEELAEQPGFLEKLLAKLDPRDSESTLAMYAHLTKYGRLQRIGTLEGGGHMFIYTEPKGTSKEGYVAGGTQGDRIVDSALSQAEQKTGGNGPTVKGLCKTCLNTVEKANGGLPYTDGDPSRTVCSATSQPHEMA